MTESEKKFLVDLQGLLLFKSEQDKENLENFIKKDESLGSLGAISYLTKQNLTETQKAQARENIGTTDGTWENMPDKPFGEADYQIEWDGTPTDKPVDAGGVYYYKVSDDFVDAESLIGGLCTCVLQENTTRTTITSDMIGTFGENLFTVTPIEADPAIIVTFAATELSGIEFPSAGIWFISVPDVIYTSNLSFSTIKQIDKKFLPDDITPVLPEGIVTTDENGLIPVSMLPSYVDDVVEGYYNKTDELFYKSNDFLTLMTKEDGKIYVDLNTGNTYRWSGSVYVRLNPDEYTVATKEQILELFN